MTPLTSAEKLSLCQAAREAAQGAHAPYSKFRVGAAILGRTEIYRGVNIENASYGLSLCAERSALASAVSHREPQIRAIAVACVDADATLGMRGVMPCGACRQWIAELARDAEILICGVDRVFRLDELMPFSFELSRRV
jgi:cytidine deaminase